ncbi:MAG: InlB B-repeat-containing protein [Propionibacteriaceae bacterium]|jgi:uncharacterized repeat protein (TIGR02543 family)|nr:InlB B-repeat-containing protein [Propionibacteriaceae bacterium]
MRHIFSKARAAVGIVLAGALVGGLSLASAPMAAASDPTPSVGIDSDVESKLIRPDIANDLAITTEVDLGGVDYSQIFDAGFPVKGFPADLSIAVDGNAIDPADWDVMVRQDNQQMEHFGEYLPFADWIELLTAWTKPNMGPMAGLFMLDGKTDLAVKLTPPASAAPGEHSLTLAVRMSDTLADPFAEVFGAWEGEVMGESSEGFVIPGVASIDTESLPNATVGAEYSAQLLATAYPKTAGPLWDAAKVRWSLAWGYLPPGMELDTETGVISGTPSRPDVYDVIVEAHTEDGLKRASRALTLAVADAEPEGVPEGPETEPGEAPDEPSLPAPNPDPTTPDPTDPTTPDPTAPAQPSTPDPQPTTPQPTTPSSPSSPGSTPESTPTPTPNTPEQPAAPAPDGESTPETPASSTDTGGATGVTPIPAPEKTTDSTSDSKSQSKPKADAKKSKKKAKVAFNVNGGQALAKSAKTVKAGAKLGSLPTPKRVHHTFLGWYTKPTGGVKATSATKAKAGKTTLYAHWHKQRKLAKIVNASMVNVRSKASMASVVVTTAKGAKAYSILAKSGSWYKVKVGGRTGYVHDRFVKVVWR